MAKTSIEGPNIWRRRGKCSGVIVRRSNEYVVSVGFLISSFAGLLGRVKGEHFGSTSPG